MQEVQRAVSRVQDFMSESKDTRGFTEPVLAPENDTVGLVKTTPPSAEVKDTDKKVILPEQRYSKLTVKVCDNCEETSEAKLGACKRCLLEFYCSKECQVEAWPSHKSVCKQRQLRGNISRITEHISKKVFRGDVFKKVCAKVNAKNPGRLREKVRYIEIDLTLLNEESSLEDIMNYHTIKSGTPQPCFFHEEDNEISKNVFAMILAGESAINKVAKHKCFILRGYCLEVEHWTLCADVESPSTTA